MGDDRETMMEGIAGCVDVDDVDVGFADVDDVCDSVVNGSFCCCVSFSSTVSTTTVVEEVDRDGNSFSSFTSGNADFSFALFTSTEE